MLKPDFAFRQTVTVTALQGTSGTGKPIYSDPILMRCRIEPEIRKIISVDGVEVITKGFIMMTAGTRFPVGTIIQWEGIKYKLLALSPIYTMEESHVEGWFN